VRGSQSFRQAILHHVDDEGELPRYTGFLVTHRVGALCVTSQIGWNIFASWQTKALVLLLRIDKSHSREA
jgi:hypothetical protein